MTKISELTRPIVGMENRTAQEVFDIMADRFRQLDKEQEGGHIQRGVSQDAPKPAGVRVNKDARALDLTKRIEREFYQDQPGGAVQTRAKVQGIIAEALYALETQEAVADGVTAELLVEHSGCGHGIQVEQVTARLAPGDAVYVVRGKLGQKLLIPKSDRIVHLFAHPTPVQKEEEGQTVSEEMVERAVRVLRRTMHMTPEERARAVLTAALVKP